MVGRSMLIDLRKESDSTLDEMHEMRESFMCTTFFSSYDLFYKNTREQFKDVFGDEEYLGVYQAFKYLNELNCYQDLELLMAYSSLNKYISTQAKSDFFVEKIIESCGDVECLTVGILSNDPDLRNENFRLIRTLEKNEYCRKMFGHLS